MYANLTVINMINIIKAHSHRVYVAVGDHLYLL